MTVSAALFVLPALSVAMIVMMLLPGCSAMPGADQELVPLQVPLPPMLFDQVTCASPPESDADPDKLTVPELVRYVEFLVGELIETDGGVLS